MLLSVLACRQFVRNWRLAALTSKRIDAQILARDERFAVRYSPLLVECSAAVQLLSSAADRITRLGVL